MSNVMELSLRGASNLEKLMRAVLLDADNKIPAERLRIVGAISEGAIIEQGSNSNGDWVRFANGTQVCSMKSSVTPEQSASIGGDFTFPAVFTSAPVLSATVNAIISQSNAGAVILEAEVLSSSTYRVKIQTIQSGGNMIAVSNNITFCAIAIGKWK